MTSRRTSGHHCSSILAVRPDNSFRASYFLTIFTQCDNLHRVQFFGVKNLKSSKVWFITGASRGFGRVWTEAALKRGDKVVATARHPGGSTNS